MSLFFRIIKVPFDLFITIIFWIYFLFGYVIFFLPILLILTPFCSDIGLVFQRINSVFYRLFFLLLKTITPGLTITINDDVKNIRSSVVIANHRSYLDPILLISLFPRHKTIVKGAFFKIPIMRWIMKSGGYIPFMQTGDSKELMIEGIQGMSQFFQEEGVLFIFPEGRRSRTDALGKFQKGAFSIASKSNVPVEILFIHNTNRLFTPGKFLLNTCIRNSITVEKIGTINPEEYSRLTSRAMRDKALDLYQKRIHDSIDDYAVSH